MRESKRQLSHLDVQNPGIHPYLSRADAEQNGPGFRGILCSVVRCAWMLPAVAVVGALPVSPGRACPAPADRRIAAATSPAKILSRLLPDPTRPCWKSQDPLRCAAHRLFAYGSKCPRRPARSCPSIDRQCPVEITGGSRSTHSRPNRAADRTLALAASSSRFFGGA